MKEKKHTGADKVRAANRALFASLTERDRKKLAARNVARKLAGLPEIKSS